MKPIALLLAALVAIVAYATPSDPPKPVTPVDLAPCLPTGPRQIAHIAKTQDGYECSITRDGKYRRTVVIKRMEVT